MKTTLRLLFVLWLMWLCGVADAQVRIRDLTIMPNDANTSLIGYGLVIGLAGTGDGNKTSFTPQTFATMMRSFGIAVDPQDLKLRNVAAVMVTTEIRSGTKAGARVDVIVSSLGDATNLQGGTLLRTVLQNPFGQPMGEAQGPVSIGGFNFESAGSRISQNHAVVGRVPGGMILLEDAPPSVVPRDSLVLNLASPDIITAVRLVRAIHESFPEANARALDIATIVADFPWNVDTPSKKLTFSAAIGELTITPESPARIVINERTGTIVVGTGVVLLPAAIAHGNLTVEISQRPMVSQPGPFSQGETVAVSQSRIAVESAGTGLQVIDGAASVGDVARVLNSLGVPPRDMIAIFQALKQAGSLRAELVII
ncbi:flagellar basal body P-ring protein FlgI [bacterium]|nr:flagellar basal body P-ring protein FlgI [bacterium]